MMKLIFISILIGFSTVLLADQENSACGQEARYLAGLATKNNGITNQQLVSADTTQDSETVASIVPVTAE